MKNKAVRGKGSRIFAGAAAASVMAALFVVVLWLALSGLSNYGDAAYLYSFCPRGVLMLLCAVAVVFFVLLYFVSGRICFRIGKKGSGMVQAALWLLLLLGQAYFLFYVRSAYKWDSGFVIGGAASLAEKGRVADEAAYYFSVYPNQNTFAVLTALLVKLGNLLHVGVKDRPLLFNLFNTLCLDTAVALVVPFLENCRGRLEEWEKCRILLLLFCNPFLYMGVSYYYTVTLSLPFTMGFFYCLSLLFFDREKENADGVEPKRGGLVPTRRLCLAALSGVLLGAGYELRATAVIFAVAAAVTGVLFVMERGKRELRRSAVTSGVVALCAVAAAGMLFVLQKAYIGLDTRDTAFPATHWIMMSLTPPGSHNAEDEAFTASFATKEEKEAAVKERIREKLSDMGVGGWLSLVKTKVKNTFGTGMNGYPLFLSEASRTDGIYQAVFGGKKDFVILWHQGWHIFVLLGILAAAVSWGYRLCRGGGNDFRIFWPGLSIFGAVLFYALWEASEQYSIPFMLLMFSLAMLGYGSFSAPWGQRGAFPAPGDPQSCSSDPQPSLGSPFPVAGGPQPASCMLALALTAGVLTLGFGVCFYPRMTGEVYPQSIPAASQILANTADTVDDGEVLRQTVRASGDFNRLVIQWRNPAEAAGTAQYRVSLCDRAGRVVFDGQITAVGSGYNGAGIYDFERENVKAGDGFYEIRIEKTGGRKEDDLAFVVYDMYGYTPYAAGDLSVSRITAEGEPSVIQKSGASLLFALSLETEDVYAKKAEYVIFVGILFLYFLFMAFWCKLETVWFVREEKYES